MVRLYKELFGPTKARTNFAGPDTILRTLEDSLTPAERTMADSGEHQRPRDARTFFRRPSRLLTEAGVKTSALPAAQIQARERPIRDLHGSGRGCLRDC